MELILTILGETLPLRAYKGGKKWARVEERGNERIQRNDMVKKREVWRSKLEGIV